ncbi:MAG: 23S rRNA (pseudouridine(1915)-N(3))-methyltransferase RlmH [Holosporales bacterium]
MKTSIIAVGRMKQGPLLDLYQDYAKRLTPSPKLIEVEAKKNLSGDALKTAEAELIHHATPPHAVRVVLDERGALVSSSDLSRKLEQWRTGGFGEVCFILGGADGHTEATRQTGQWVWSLSPLTFPHMLARVLLVEQLYRAQQISSGHPYHRV